MDFSWGTVDRPPAMWVVDLGLLCQPGPIPSRALQTLSAGDFGQGLDTVASWGGAALALAAWKATPGAGFALAVGRAVRAGQATASRASILARSPLTGHLSQGQVGSELARRLGRLCDGILLKGSTQVADAVLVLHEQGGFSLHSIPGLKAMDTRRSAQAMVEAFGPCSVLRPGPAAHAGVLWSNLCAGQDPASFVGSGGMGAVLAGMGLAGLVVCASPVEAAQEEDGWLQSLQRSPRLIARAQGQSLQEADRDPVHPNKLERHGCAGCPTPCGFTFERPDRSKGGARFSALRPLMELAGDSEGRGTQALLQTCNDLGVDAREAAACLQWVVQHGDSHGLDLSSLLRRLCLHESDAGLSAAFRKGASALALHLGVEPHGQVANTGPATDMALLLAKHLGVRGAEPLRSYPFLVGQQTDAMRMRAIVAPLMLIEGSENQSLPNGKGRLLWWHENLISGVDVLGICAFSVAALLSDGVFNLEELAQCILPEAVQVPGAQNASEAMLAVGANALLLFREVDFAGRPNGEIPLGSLKGLPPGLLAEGADYRSLRGLRDDGLPQPDSLAALGRSEWTRIPEHMYGPSSEGCDASLDPPPAQDRSTVEVQLRFQGALAPRLGSSCSLRLEGEPTLMQALEALAQLHPRTAHWLVAQGRPVPAVMRGDEILNGVSRLSDGDVLDLVLAISGG